MNRLLANKVALITGGTRGIGLAIAGKLAEAGARIAICGQNPANVEKALTHLRSGGHEVIGKAADVSKQEDVIDLFQLVDEHFGGVDILVNNAGIGRFAPVADLGFEDWQRTLGVNLSGAYYCSHEALPRFKKRGGGFIVNMSSLAGKNAFAGGAAYNASKAGLNIFGESMMLDHRYDNVRVSSIMPGSVATEFGRTGSTGAEWKIAPEDVADVVLIVLSMPERTMISAVEIRPSQPRK
jgi:3-oxoacyl-[acyl-carrier protein] reductase